MRAESKHKFKLKNVKRIKNKIDDLDNIIEIDNLNLYNIFDTERELTIEENLIKKDIESLFTINNINEEKQECEIDMGDSTQINSSIELINSMFFNNIINFLYSLQENKMIDILHLDKDKLKLLLRTNFNSYLNIMYNNTFLNSSNKNELISNKSDSFEDMDIIKIQAEKIEI